MNRRKLIAALDERIDENIRGRPAPYHLVGCRRSDVSPIEGGASARRSCWDVPSMALTSAEIRPCGTMDLESRLDRRRPCLKPEAILDAAGRHFLGAGYDAAAMDAIASDLGVSRPALYRHFPSKGALLAAYLERYCRARSDAIAQMDRSGAQQFVRLFVTHSLRDESIAHLRLAASTACQFPALGRAWYEAGDALAIEILARCLRQEGWAFESCLMLADHLLGLSQDRLLVHRLCNVEPVPSEEMFDLEIEGAFATFLAAARAGEGAADAVGQSV